MGLRIQEVPQHYFPLMSLEDQAFYKPSTAPDPKLEVHPPPKRNSAERKEQGQFANWLLLQRSEGRRLPFSWHATHRPSKATPGTPDFWVGVNRVGMWIEFKRDYSCDLTPEQEQFRLDCEAQEIPFHVVYSAFEAIRLVREAMSLFDIL